MMAGCSVIDLYDQSIASGHHRQKHHGRPCCKDSKQANHTATTATCPPVKNDQVIPTDVIKILDQDTHHDFADNPARNEGEEKVL